MPREPGADRSALVQPESRSGTHCASRCLRIVGQPHCGGQGVYVRHLSGMFVDLGHHVEVLAGQPYPVLDERVPLIEFPSLDIYNDHFPGRMLGFWS